MRALRGLSGTQQIESTQGGSETTETCVMRWMGLIADPFERHPTSLIAMRLVHSIAPARTQGDQPDTIWPTLV